MEISRLPPVFAGRPAGNAHNRAARPEEAAQAASNAAVQSRGAAERVRVVQGELLQRERTSYQSTRAFIDERAFDNALATRARADAAAGSRSAISRYLHNAPVEPTGAPAVRRTLNFYV